MRREDLHKEVHKLLPGRKKNIGRMMLHALIDLGRVKKLECQAERCKYRTRKFSPGGKQKLGLTFEHLDDLGGDRPENISVLHNGCNSSKGAKDYWKKPESKRKLAKVLKLRWKNDSSYRQLMLKRMSGKNHWSRKPGALKKYPKGKNHWSRQPWAKMILKRAGAKQSKTKRTK